MIDLATIRNQAALDIRGGMPFNEFDKFYPELKDEKVLFSEYESDVQGGMPEEQDSTFYPEIFRKAEVEEAQVEDEQTLIERGVEGVKGFAKGAERTLARTASGAAPFLTAGIVSKEELQQKTGLEKADTFGEKAAEVVGAGTGIVAQAIPIARGVQLAGKAIIVAAGSVVVKDVEDDFVLVAGNPAQIVRRYEL